MPYDIFGFVETAPPGQGPWLAAFSVSEIVGCPNDFSEEVFGLSKFAREGAPFANRGLPLDASAEVQDWMASIARFEKEEGADCGDHGQTYATLAEVRKISVSSDSPWQIVFAKVTELRREFGFSDAEIRVVLWANW